MTLSPWFAVALAIPVLLAGEWMVQRFALLRRFNIPSPVAGGLLFSVVVLIGNLSGLCPVQFEPGVTDRWWTWIVTIEPEWIQGPSKSVGLPLLVAFFTCIGLNASGSLLRRGGAQVVIFLALAAVLAVVQNLVGVGLALCMGISPMLGLVCGSATLTGGHGTALGFAAEFEKAGLSGAAVIGAAAATFGLVAGGLLGGPIGGGLIRRHSLRSSADLTTHLEPGQAGSPGILSDFNAASRYGRALLWHLLLLLGCIKAGAWVSFLIHQAGLTFPVYIGAMLLGLIVRNLMELSGRPWIKTEIIDVLASISLSLFLSITMMSLNLIELAGTALPMLVVLCAQVAVMAAFAWLITFRFCGKDYDAAVIAGGHCGFGLGATANAVANMKALVERFGAAPRAFLVVPIVGAFLIDLVNAANITVFLNVFGAK